MKLKYNVERKASMQSRFLLDKAISTLKRLDYGIVETTNSTILFKDKVWQIRPKGAIFRKVDSGKIELVDLAEGSLIRLTYYVSFHVEVILIAIIAIISALQNYYILMITLPLIIQFIVRIDTLKTTSAEMIERIASLDGLP